MRITFISNVPWGSSGYSTETARVTQRMKAAGHDVNIIANFGLHDTKMEWNGINVYPGNQFDQTQVSVIDGYVKELDPDIVITLWDVHGIPGELGLKCRWVPWLPIDRHPLPQRIGDALKTAYHILPWCEQAKGVIAEGGFTNQTIIPLSVDTKVFRPLVGHEVIRGGKKTGEIATKKAFKEGLGATEDNFVIGMVAINQDTRKNIHRVINAVGMVRDEIPEIRLHLHCPAFRPGGLNLNELVVRAKIEGVTTFTEAHQYFRGLSLYEMASMYNAMDVLMLPSSGEGFGLPLVEANACGVPTVYGNNTAMPEVAYGVGINPVSWEIYPEPTNTGLPDATYRAVISDEQVAQAIRYLYSIWKNDKDEWAEQCEAARKSAMRFDADYVYETYWEPTLAKLEEQIKGEQEWRMELPE